MPTKAPPLSFYLNAPLFGATVGSARIFHHIRCAIAVFATLCILVFGSLLSPHQQRELITIVFGVTLALLLVASSIAYWILDRRLDDLSSQDLADLKRMADSNHIIAAHVFKWLQEDRALLRQDIVVVRRFHEVCLRETALRDLAVTT